MVSIGLPAYNGERFLREALDSLLAQTFADFELIVSDNASTDSTPQICRSYTDPRIRYVRQPRNLGVFGNTEFLIRHATKPLFMLVGDDDVYEPTFIETMAGLMKPDVVLAYSNFGYIGEDGKRGAPVGLVIPSTPEWPIHRNITQFLLRRPALPMMMGVFRRDAMLKSLPFETERMKPSTYNVDNIFLLKVLTLGKLNSSSETLFYYRQKDRRPSFPADWPEGLVPQLLYTLRHYMKVSRAFSETLLRSGLPRRRLLYLWAWVTHWLVYGVYVKIRLTDRPSN